MECLKINIPGTDDNVSGLMLRPAEAKALYLFAHGAGAGMTHKSMAANAEGLAARGIATLRRQRRLRSWHLTCRFSPEAAPSADA